MALINPGAPPKQSRDPNSTAWQDWFYKVGVFISKIFTTWYDTGYSYQTPITGFSITLGNTTTHTILDPAGALASGTIVMPASPSDGLIVTVSTTQTITTLTVSPNTGQTVKNAPTTMPAGFVFSYIYRSANTTWYRLQ